VPESRPAAVAAVLAGRLTVHDVAESHDVTPGAVRAWIRDARRTARAT
jgi:transposase-like protein